MTEPTAAPLVTDTQLAQRYQLVADLLGAEPMPNPALLAYRRLIEEDLLQWLAGLRLPGAGATAVLQLQGVLDRLELLVSVPPFRQSRLVAVAGGFSSGKSSFITSLMSDAEIGLPVGIEPVTAIPTYVISADATAVHGYTPLGGMVQLDASLYARLSHSFVRSFGFNLRTILPFVALETPLGKYRHLALMDLPGFGAPASNQAYTDADDAQANAFLAQAQAVVWVMGIDANGEIGRGDLAHLHGLAEAGKPIYLLLNKADLRPPADVQSVLDRVWSTLRAEGLKALGACTYSARQGLALAHKGQSLSAFLRSMDAPSDGQQVLIDEVTLIFRSLFEGLKRSGRETEQGMTQLKRLEADLVELGLFDEGAPDDLIGLGGRRRRRRLVTIQQSSWDALCALEAQVLAMDGREASAEGRRIADSLRDAIREAF